MLIPYISGEHTYLQTRLPYETKIKNMHIIVVSMIGQGKTIETERILEDYYNTNAVIIVLIDPKNNLESAYSMFEPKEKYHLARLKKQKNSPRSYPVKIYHPFSFDIPIKEKIPETKFYTISLKSLIDRDLKFLLESEEEDTTYEILRNSLLNLNDNEGIYEWMHSIQKSLHRKTKRIGHEIIRSADPDSFFLEGVSSGNITSMDEIQNLFKIFDHHFMLMPENFSMNLNIEEILNDNKTIHVFTCRHIKESEKIRDFNAHWLLNQIEMYVEFSKYQIALDIPELAKFIPRKPQGYKRILSHTFKNFLSIVRSKDISTISNTQAWSEIDDSTAKFFSDPEIGSNLTGELLFYSQDLKIKKAIIDQIKELDRGWFIHLKHQYYGKHEVFMPRHMHQEEGYRFDKIFAQHFPDRMINYGSLVKEVRDYRNEIRFAFKQKADEKEQRKREVIQRKIKDREQKLEEREKIELLKIKQKEIGTRSVQERNNIIIKLSRELDKDGKSLSSRKIAERLMNDYAIKYSYKAVANFLKKQIKKSTPSDINITK